MKTCEKVVRDSAVRQIMHKGDPEEGSSTGVHEKHTHELGREFSSFLTVENDNPETVENPEKDDESAVENIRSVLNYLSQQSEGPGTSVGNAGQNRPVYEQLFGSHVQPFGIGLEFNIGQQPVYGGIQRPRYKGQAWNRYGSYQRPSYRIYGQPRGQPPSANVQPVYGHRTRDPFYAHGPLQRNRQAASFDGA